MIKPTNVHRPQATRPAPAGSKRHPMSLARRSLFSLALSTGLAGVLGACTADAEDVRPTEADLFFPTGIVVAPDDSVAFVINANSELRYDSGTISVLELATVDEVVAAWTGAGSVPEGCAQDLDRTETLTCDESLFIRQRAGVRIGNFATDVALQDLGEGRLRLVVPTRGDPSITWADWDGSKLQCSASDTGGFGQCDGDHRLSFILNDADKPGLPEEPFSVYADSAGEYAIVTHLSNGAVTLVDSPKSGEVRIADVLTGVFGADPLTGQRGATGVVGRPSSGPGIVYVGSRSEDRVQTFTVGRPVNNAAPFLLPGAWFFLESVGEASGGESTDTRGMAFSPDGSRLYLVNRRPPSLQILDTSIGDAGYPLNKPIGATDICRQASTVTLSGTGDDERAYVTCFQDGQVYVVDPRGAVSVEDILLVGRGPYAAATARTRNKLLVTNFLEDTVAVIDIAPGSPTRNRVVLRIGKPRAL